MGKKKEQWKSKQMMPPSPCSNLPATNFAPLPTTQFGQLPGEWAKKDSWECKKGVENGEEDGWEGGKINLVKPTKIYWIKLFKKLELENWSSPFATNKMKSAFQVMLLGDSCTGKTCLLIRFKDNTFMNKFVMDPLGLFLPLLLQ